MRTRIALLALAVSTGIAQADPEQEFNSTIKPVLMQNCAACHNPAAVKLSAPFLRAASVTDIDKSRRLWRNVATQLRNRTMPPRDSKLAEEDRIRIASWIDSRLRATACTVGDHAGPAVT